MTQETNQIIKKIKVLHVDDDESQLIFLKEFVESNSDIIKVSSVNNPIKAIEIINTERYDCVVSDYVMPILNGIEMAEKIKEFSDIPIILYTGQGSEEVAEKAFNVGIDDYIKKELDISHYMVLTNKINNIVEKYLTNKLYTKIAQFIDDSIIVVDNKLKVVYHNNNFIKIMGQKFIIGKPIIEIFEKPVKKDILKFFNNEIKKTESVIVGEKNISRFVEINKINIDDVYQGFNLFVIRDITEHKVNESIKSLSEGRFKTIAEIMPDAIMIGNILGFVTYVNPTFCKLTGFSEEEVIGKHYTQIQTLKSQNVGQIWKVIKQVISGNKKNDWLEFPYLRKDGTTGIGDAFVSLVNIDGKRELISVVRDVTKRKMREEEYENLFKSSPEGIMHLDMEGNIKAINETAYKILNIDPDNFLGKNILEYNDEISEQLGNIDLLYERIISGSKIEPFEIKIDDNKNIKWLEIIVSLITVYAEKLGLQIVLRDITNKKEVELDKEKYTTELETLVEERTRQIIDNEKMVAIGKISSMIVHDLKGPLQVINNSLHLIKMKPDDIDTFLKYIGESVQRSNDMLDELSMNVKQTPLNLEKVILEEIIDASLLQIKVIKNVTYEKILKTKSQLKLDRSKFIRVLDNLLKNAVEAMPKGGKITIVVDEEQDNIIIQIIDTGVGISKEKLDTLFRPFQSTKSKGMGLGLMFCKNTVEKHGGKITVDSELEKGTTFTITIPKHQEILEERYIEQTTSINNTLIS